LFCLTCLSGGRRGEDSSRRRIKTTNFQSSSPVFISAAP
jgi:hypothetical protein